jgi:hypothetical protein
MLHHTYCGLPFEDEEGMREVRLIEVMVPIFFVLKESSDRRGAE